MLAGSDLIAVELEEHLMAAGTFPKPAQSWHQHLVWLEVYLAHLEKADQMRWVLDFEQQNYLLSQQPQLKSASSLVQA